LRAGGDWSEQEQVRFEDWLVANARAFEFFRAAVERPYYWLERKVAGVPPRMGEIIPFELDGHRDLVGGLIWNAKLAAAAGRFEAAFEDLLTCYRSGDHLCRPNQLLMDQYLGLRIKCMAVEEVFSILDRYHVPDEALQYLQDALAEQVAGETYLPSIEMEKFFIYDALQRTFIDDGKGTGRWAWSSGWPHSLLSTGRSPLEEKIDDLKARFACCLTGPTQSDIRDQVERILDLSEAIMDKTPWQIRNEGIDTFQKIKRILNSHLFFVISGKGPDPQRIHYTYYKTLTHIRALTAVLAIFRYRNDTGRLPESLEQLTAAGILQSVPDDPFSDGPLLYRRIKDGFRLYSVGEDFTDDGGVIPVRHPLMAENGMFGMYPVPSDLICWPGSETRTRQQETVDRLCRQALESEDTDYAALFDRLRELDALGDLRDPDELKRRVENARARRRESVGMFY